MGGFYFTSLVYKRVCYLWARVCFVYQRLLSLLHVGPDFRLPSSKARVLTWRTSSLTYHPCPVCLGFFKHFYYLTQAGLKIDTYWPLLGPQVCTITPGKFFAFQVLK